VQRFGYVRAESVPHAVALLNEPGIGSRPLAGGTDLVLLAREDHKLCDRVVDISLIPELHQITLQDGVLTIGAAATFAEIIASPNVRQAAPLLVEACHQVGATQIRNMGTVGGNVANAAACADSLPALICLDAWARLLTPDGAQELPVSDLVVAPNRTLIPEGGLLESLSFKAPDPTARSVFLKVGRRNAMAISRLTVAVLGRLDEEGCIAEARIAAGSATPAIRRFPEVEVNLVCRMPGEDLWKSAGRQVAEEMIRVTGRRWSSEYKESALEGLVARALAQVFAPAHVSTPGDGSPGDGSRTRSIAPPEPVVQAVAPAAFAGGIPVGRSEPMVAWPADDAPGPGKQTPATELLSFNLNGRPVAVAAPADRTLLNVLRDDLGLTGTKEGCNVGECGACSVLLDGQLVNSCLVLARQADGRSVVTIEGVRGADGGPNDLQQAFIDYGAVQCGYCIPGMVLAGEALLSRHPQPARAQIREAIAGNLCRCTGYQQIVDAIEATARQRAGRPVSSIVGEL
jgi:carbon-monoxide dehydrogenase medium subunit